MANKTDYKAIFFSSATTAVATAITIAVVNMVMKPTTNGLGNSERTLLQLPLKNMAVYADMVTKLNVNNLSFLKERFDMVDVNDPMTYKTGSKQNIGNCAYVALNTKHTQYRDMAVTILNNFKKHANGEF